jgi:ATP-binding cassette, subfamily B, multidrug efflux pump
MSIGEVQAFIQYSRQFTQPLTQLASMAERAAVGHRLGSSGSSSCSTSPSPSRPTRSGRSRPPCGSGRVRRRRFSYDPESPLIDDLSLVAEPGQTVAIVGPTGAGKTTLVNLLMRFYELDGGRITLDGVDISTMTRDELRRDRHGPPGHVAVRRHDPREHRYGNPDATDEQMLEAARAPTSTTSCTRCPTATTPSSTTRRQRQRRREAAAHDRPGVPADPDRS